MPQAELIKQTNVTQRRPATAATEFALVLPLVVVVAFGCIDFGRAMQVYTVMSSAASAGAQRGATTRLYWPHTHGAWETSIRHAIQEELASLTARGAPISAFQIQISTDAQTFSDAASTTSLPRTTVTVDHNFRTTFRWPGLPRVIPLHCESVIRQYR